MCVCIHTSSITKGGVPGEVAAFTDLGKGGGSKNSSCHTCQQTVLSPLPCPPLPKTQNYPDIFLICAEHKYKD